MPTIYRREPRQVLHDIFQDTIDRLIREGRLSHSGETEFVMMDPNGIGRPTTRRISTRNMLTGEVEEREVPLVNHMTTSRIRWNTVRDEITPDIHNIDEAEVIDPQIINRGGATLDDFNNMMSTLERTARTTPLAFTTSSVFYDWNTYPAFGKKSKEDRSKYSKTLNKIIDTVHSFEKNLNKILGLRKSNEGFGIYIGPKDGDILKVKKFLIKDNETKSFKIITDDKYFPNNKMLNSLETIKSLCFVKVKSCEESIRLFRNKNIKMEMMESGENFIIANILLNFECKEDGIARDIVEVTSPNGSKNYKFCIEDLEFILPNTDELTKGYNPPKDRTVKKGKEVRLVDNRKIGLPKDTKLIVSSIVKTGTKNYCTAKYNNKEYTIPINKLKVT